MGNPVVHFEMAAPDNQLLVAFYGEMFNWRMQTPPGDDYTVIDSCAGHGCNGGIAKSNNGEPWATFYVEVDDPQVTLDQVNLLGGTTAMPVTEAGGATIAMFKDLDNLPVGLIAASAEASSRYSSTPSAGKGEMFDWFEVIGSDVARSQRFYGELFDWTFDDAGFPDYTVVGTGTERGILGGIGTVPSCRWATVYVWVRDLEKAYTQIEKLGGSRILDQSVPDLKNRSREVRFGEVDSMHTGAFRDPAGNVIGIFEHNAPA